MKASIGKVTAVLAEAVDLYPTLAALVGLPPPQSAGQQINGTSLVPAFEDPAGAEGSAGLKQAAFSQFAKPYRSQPFVFWPTPQRNATEIMGYTVRVDEWRYTCWFGFDGATQTPNREEILGRELYDHRGA
jgi:iduronate 2-sulfatase